MEPEVVSTEPVATPTETQAPVEAAVGTEAAEETTTATPATPELYDLPDGRKVTGAELRTLYAEELLPEYTRKSQELARLQNQHKPEATANQGAESWTPQTYEEILEKAEQRVFEKLTLKQQEEQEARQQLASTIDAQVAELKKVDPNLNESQLFQHATKYGFGNLSMAYQNMKDMNLVVQATEQRVQKNLAQRAGLPIAGNAKSGSAASEGIEYNPLVRESPQEALRRLQSH